MSAFFRVAWHVMKKDLTVEVRSLEILSTTLFFAVGAGAIVLVVYELWRLFARRSPGGLLAPLNAAGVLLGMVVMYLTGLLVTA